MVEVNVQFRRVEDVRDFVNTVSKYPFDVDIKKGSKVLDGKSLEGLYSLELNSKLICVLHEHEENSQQYIEKLQKYRV